MKINLFTTAAVILGLLIGLAVGVGGYTFIYAKGSSYLTNDPAACANCHVMSDQYAGWTKSSHHAVAACNDCHTPHSLIPKYVVKARNGFWHSFYFTSGRFPEPIRITERNFRVTEGACRSCHEDIVLAIEGPHGDEKSETSCIQCHRNVGHMH